MKTTKKAVLVVAIVVFSICSLAISEAESYCVSEEQVLIVSVPYADYFNDARDGYGLQQFLATHQDWTIKTIVQKNPSIPFQENADVYFVNQATFDIESLLWMENDLADLSELLDTQEQNCVIGLEQLRDQQNRLMAVPVFWGVYVIYVNEEALEMCVNPSTIQTNVLDLSAIIEMCTSTSSMNQSQTNFLLGDLEIFTRHLELLATDLDYSRVDFFKQEIVNCMNVIKALYDKGFINLSGNEDGKECSYILEISHGMLYDWFTERDHVKLFYSFLDGTANQSIPLAARVGCIDGFSNHKQIAAEFIMCFTALDEQLQLPTAGIVNKEAWKTIRERNASRDHWSILMNEWWGKPITAEEYEIYIASLTNSRIGIGSFLFTKDNSMIIEKFLTGRLTCNEALIALQKRFDDYITMNYH